MANSIHKTFWTSFSWRCYPHHCYIAASSEQCASMHKMRRFRSSCACAKHPDFCSPFIHLVVSNDSVIGQRRPRQACADAQADLGLRYKHVSEDTFSDGSAYTRNEWLRMAEAFGCIYIFIIVHRRPLSYSLIIVLLNPDMSCLRKQCRSDQLASEEANWSGSALFAIENVNLYQ